MRTPGVPLAGLYPLDDDHRTICQPKSRQSPIHLKTVSFVRDCLRPADGDGEEKPRFDEVLKVNLKGHGTATLRRRSIPESRFIWLST